MLKRHSSHQASSADDLFCEWFFTFFVDKQPFLYGLLVDNPICSAFCKMIILQREEEI
ncbi:MAG: hypothetical protein Metus_1657 [Candidatus Methanosuratincola subterraneus]|uniref:Uncharacterized protein n=1 Tax=Methanosuratincola subterraneus TaxID=2593994 RepID=A0A444L546_METS7|nr:MAG: hypothetical protein Metus_1657 [Candidatus Methanosuratincola subterraneus]